MSTKKVVPMLLAASVMVTGFTGTFVMSNNAAYGITSVDELSDVNKTGWAFDALKDLVEKYNVIEGYPDKTFRGDHKATRDEMAAALNALIRHIGKDIARLGAEKADKEDLAKLAKLQEEFKAELEALKARTTALEERAAKIEAKNEEQDNRLTVLEKLKIYGDVTFGGFAEIGGRGADGTSIGAFQGNLVPTLNGTNALLGTPVFNVAQARTTEGLSDSISMLGRVRVNLDYPIVEDTDKEGIIGEGKLHTRLVAAFGRVSPMLSGADAGRTTTGSGMLSGISKIAGDASLFNEGIRTSSIQSGIGNQINGAVGANVTQTGIVGGSDVRANAYVDSAYYTQEFRSGIPILTDLLPGVDVLPNDENWKTSMKMHAGLIPWREIFQKSPYTGDENTQLQNVALVNNAAIPVNVTAPTVAFEWHQGLGKWHSLDVRTALSAIDVSDAFGALGITYEGSLNYNWGWAADWLNLPGNIYAGGFQVEGRGGSNGLLGTISNGALNSSTIQTSQDFLRGLSQDPGTMIRNNLSRASVAGSLAGTSVSTNTVANVAGQSVSPLAAAALGVAAGTPFSALTNQQLLNHTAILMGLPVGALNSSTTLSAVLGVSVANIANESTALPAATIAGINANLAGIGSVSALPANATMGDYIRILQGNFVSGATTQLLGQAGIAINNAVPGLPSGNNGTFDDNDNVNGFYIGVNQEIHRGAGVFFSYAVMDTGPQSTLLSALQSGTGRNVIFNGGSGNIGRFYAVKESMNVGMEIPLKALHLPWRHKDCIGFGYAVLKPNDAYGTAYSGTRDITGRVHSAEGFYVSGYTPDQVNGNLLNPNTTTPIGVQTGATSLQGNVAALANLNNTVLVSDTRSTSEHVVEAYYKVQLNDRFSITPSIQMIINRLGEPENNIDTVLGLRSSFTF